MVAPTKKQKLVYDFLEEYIKKYGYAPSIKEICDHFGTTSVGTMQKLLVTLHEKGMIKRDPKKKRAIELIKKDEPEKDDREIPVIGCLSENAPIENYEMVKFMKMPEEISLKKYTYILKVKGDFLSGEKIWNGDYIIIESKDEANDDEQVLIRLEKKHVTLRRILKENKKFILQPTNPEMKTLVVKETDVKILGVMIGVFRYCFEQF